MCRQWCANQCWLACLPTVVGEPANGGWQACQCWLASRVTSISIYRPRSFRSKYKFFLSVRLASGYEPGRAPHCLKTRHHVKYHQRRRILQSRASARKRQLSNMEVLDEDGIAGKGLVGGGQW